MNTNLTELIIILDRSGSMSSIKKDMEGGLNTFITDQAKGPGECRVSLYQFDNVYEAVFENVPINEVKPIQIAPRGNTALYDALGRTINAVGARLAATPEKTRAGAVLVIAVTDGQENASTEFTVKQVKELVTHQETKYSWGFTYLGANQDGVLNGTAMGFNARSSISYSANSVGIIGAIASVSGYATRFRSMAASSCGGSVSYSDEDRKSAMGKP